MDQQSDTDDYFNPIDDGMDANFFWSRKKHKKKRRKKKKWYRRLFGGYKSNGITNNEADARTNLAKISNKNGNTDFSEFNDIKFRIQPNQEEDIVKFINNVNSVPQTFNFDVDSFIAKRKMEPVKSEVSTEKTYYEFIPLSDDMAQRNGDLENVDNVDVNTVEDKKKFKRDILTQHLKSIANKISLFPSARSAFDLDNEMMAEKTPSNYADLYSNNINQYDVENSFDPQADEFVDKFYLLNDGEKYENVPLQKGISNKLTNDLDIDLDLDRKFRNLNYSKNNLFYSDIANNFTLNDDGQR